MGESYFTKGMEVEVCSDDEGLRGAWFAGTVIRPATKRHKVVVQYKTLVSDDNGCKPLREYVDEFNLRPIPPPHINPAFKVDDDVDAYHNDGWWEGVVTRVLDSSKYLIYFRGAKEELQFGLSDLRVHREWRGHTSWLPPVQEKPNAKNESDSAGSYINLNEMSSKLEVEFIKGMRVEVSSDEEGFVGAWFTATIIEVFGKGKFLVEYDTLRTDDDSALLKEEVHGVHIRPLAPEIPQVERYCRLEEVDAFYNEAWWVGVISKVLSESSYYVYFRETNEELEFDHSQLRLHQDWIDRKWIRSSVALMLT